MALRICCWLETISALKDELTSRHNGQDGRDRQAASCGCGVYGGFLPIDSVKLRVMNATGDGYDC